MASTRSASRTRAASFGLMPMPTSPAYSGWRLSKRVLEAKAAADRQLPGLGKTLQRTRALCASSRSRRRWPAGARPRASSARRSRSAPGAGQACAGTARGSTGAAVGVVSMSSGKHQHHRARPALHRGVKGTRHVLGQSVGLLDLGNPLGHAERAGAEDLPVVEFLKGLAVALVAGHLADEQHHRRRVLERGVQTDRRIARAGTAGHEAHPGPAGQLALRFGHEGCATFVAAGDEADVLGVLDESRRARPGSSRRARRRRCRCPGRPALRPARGRRVGCRRHAVTERVVAPCARRSSMRNVTPSARASAAPKNTPSGLPPSSTAPNTGAASAKPRSSPE